MDPRFDRAHGAMAGLFYGQALEVDTAVDKGSKSTSLSESILALMVTTESAKQPTFSCFTTPVDRFCGLMLRAVQLGIATSIDSPQAFVDAVWDNSQKQEPTRQEFQATALVAAAVSIGLDSPHFRVKDALVRAVDTVSSVEAHGEWSPEPDVLAATRRALNIASDVNGYIGFSLERLSEQIGSAGSPAQIVPTAFALASCYQDRRLLTSPLRLGAQAHTILSIVGALIGAVRGASFLRPYGLSRVEDACPLNLADRAESLLTTRTPYPSGGLTPGASAPPVAPSAPASFEEPSSSLHTRQRYFESVNPPTPLKVLRGEAQPGRVVFLGELLADHVMHGHKYPQAGESVWASDHGWTAGGMFRAMAAARHMGAEVVSLSPIGQGPNARIITQALRRMNIIDAGPHLSGVDNGYRLQFSADEGYRMILRGTNNDWHMTLSTTTPLPSLASHKWTESLQALDPWEILWIDGALMGHEPTAQALNVALRGLPEHVRVVFDGASDEGVPDNLPLDNVLMSLRIGNLATFSKHFNAGSTLTRYTDQPEDQATALCLISERHIVAGTADNAALFVRPTLDNARILSPSRSRVPGPSINPAVRAERVADVHSGTLAACLALGISIERGILLANCAAALATPDSLATRDAVEAAARELLTRDQA